MRLNSLGTILGGVGGVGVKVSVDGVVPAALSGTSIGGAWGWLTDDIIAGQGDTSGGTGPYALLQYVISTTTRSVLDATPTGANDAAQNFRAGNSEWAAFMSAGALKGVRSATVPFAGGGTVGTCTVLPSAGLGDIDEAGRVFTIANFASDAGIVAYAGSGSRLWTSATSVLDGSNRMRARDGSVAYEDTSGHWHLASATTGASQAFAPRTDEVIAAMVPVSISGTIWVVELSVTKLTIRPATSSTGYVLATSANLFNPDAVQMSAGTVRVGWSVTTGEANTDLRVADLTVGTGGLTTGTTSSGSLVLTPQTPATPSAFPVGPVEGGSVTATKQPRQAIKAESFVGGERGMVVYQKWWDTIAGQAVTSPNLSQSSGSITPAQGGTGTTTGLTQLNGANLIQDTTPLDTAQNFGPYVLATGRNLILTDPLHITTYVVLQGTANLRVV